jgi:hypothetical protein
MEKRMEARLPPAPVSILSVYLFCGSGSIFDIVADVFNTLADVLA